MTAVNHMLAGFHQLREGVAKISDKVMESYNHCKTIFGQDTTEELDSSNLSTNDPILLENYAEEDKIETPALV